MDSLSSLENPHHTSQHPFAVAVLRLAFIIVAATYGTAVRGQADDRSLATVNGRSITLKQVDSLIVAQTRPLEEKIYALRKAALENLITRRVLEDEAEKRGISVSELRKELASGDVRITPNQVEEAYANNASFFASMSPDEAKERLRLDLENQGRMQNYRAGLKKLRDSAKVDLFLNEPRLSLVSEHDASPSVGPKDAVVTVVEYSDFECPYCREVQNPIKELLKFYSKQIKLVFRHLPLKVHAQSFQAAQAAFCAGEQGSFWEYHDALFSSDSLRPETLTKIASSLNLDLSKFNDCLTSEAARSAIQLNLNEANRLGINSTPTFVINGKLVRGALSLAEFTNIVEYELKAAKASRSQQPQPARKE